MGSHIKALTPVLVTCNNVETPIKNEGARVATTILTLNVYVYFSRCSRAANSIIYGRIWPKFEHIRDVTAVLVTCKNEEDLIKNCCARGLKTLYFFQTLKGNSVVIVGI